MHGIGKALLASAATIVLISGAVVLSTGEASAQFNVEGLIRGAIAHGYYGGGGRSPRHRRYHETKRDRHSKEARDETRGKGKNKSDHSDKQTQQANQTNRSNDEQAKDKGQSQSASPAMSETRSQQPAVDVPALTPER
ncbi:MAG: hypothetical protein ACRECV_02470 [Xanthobacteraceae bacterium]